MATTITSGNSTNGAAISSDNTGILELKTGTGAGTTAITIDASQNVGIGISSPSQELVVYKDQNATTRVSIDNTNAGTTASASLELSADTGAAIFVANSSGSTAAAITGGALGAGLYTTSAATNGLSVGTTSGPLKFFAGNTSAERFRIGSAGQLGVGGANYGTAGQALVSNGASSAPSWQTVATTPDVQTFNVSGTWTKPSTGNLVRIQMWGGGGGGSRSASAGSTGGGGGGGYYETTLPIASMGATATVTVGAGGPGRTGSAGAGIAGGNSSVVLGSGSIIYVSGGAGSGGTLGGDGGYGSLTFTTAVVADPANIGKGAGLCSPQDGYAYTGGGGGAGTSLTAGGKGGWGGGGGTTGTGAGGTSIFGGAGGNASTNGTQPGGGGGASTAANTNATNGAAGRVIITTF